MKALFKRLTRTEGFRRIACRLGAAYIGLVERSSRWRVLGRERIERFWEEGKPFIGVFWHGRMLMVPCFWPKERPVAMLISRHADGQLIAETVRHFGVGTIAGSSSEGGGEALRQIIRHLKRGVSIGITPDGPRGPRMRASAGAVQAARLAQTPIVPVAVATSRRRVLGSWDRFAVALPFSTGVFLWGEPIAVPADANAAEIERLRARLEQSLNALSREADLMVGQEPIEPAPDLAHNHAE